MSRATSEVAVPMADDEFERYARQLALPNVGVDGQSRLRRARVLIIGAGGLGSPAALYLAAAGVGTIGLVDDDVVTLGNLQRQLLHTTAAVGERKVDSARQRLHALNPRVEVEAFPTRLSATNVLEIMPGFDVLLDGSDNLATRYLTNDAALLLGVPNVYGSVFRFEGQVSLFARSGPCYRCLFREPPRGVPDCETAGVLGVVPGLVGTIQATEAIKLLLGIGESLVGRLLLLDALSMRMQTITVNRDPACPTCGDPARGGRTIASLGEHEEDYVDQCDPAIPSGVTEMSVTELAALRGSRADFDLIDVREPHEWATGHIEGAQLVPLGTIPAALDALPRDRALVLYCKAGVRSWTAAQRLAAVGFTHLVSVRGGILQWRDEVDEPLSTD